MAERLIWILLVLVLLIKVCERMWYYYMTPSDDLYSDYRNEVDEGEKRFKAMLREKKIVWAVMFVIIVFLQFALLFCDRIPFID